jgi:hypothetical protein
MPRTHRLTSALRSRKALASLGAAAALAGAGAGTAAAVTSTSTGPAARPAPLAAPATRAATLHASNGSQHPATLRPATSTTTGGTTTSGSGSGSGSGGGSGSSQPGQGSQQAAQQLAHRDQQAAGGQLTSTGSYQLYDSVTPAQIPAGHPVATYADGPYAARPAQLAGKQTLWIDTNATDPGKAAVLDVEPGDATPAQAATWVHQRETAHPGQLAVVYTMMSDWAAAKQAISALPHAMQANVRWWIADPTGTPHIVPGATATQWYWGTSYDISSANGTL